MGSSPSTERMFSSFSNELGNLITVKVDRAPDLAQTNTTTKKVDKHHMVNITMVGSTNTIDYTMTLQEAQELNKCLTKYTRNADAMYGPLGFLLCVIGFIMCVLILQIAVNQHDMRLDMCIALSRYEPSGEGLLNLFLDMDCSDYNSFIREHKYLTCRDAKTPFCPYFAWFSNERANTPPDAHVCLYPNLLNKDEYVFATALFARNASGVMEYARYPDSKFMGVVGYWPLECGTLSELISHYSEK